MWEYWKLEQLLGPSLIITQFVTRVFPRVRRELANWQEQAGKIPDATLRTQALASIATKRFHCQGGSIYALYPGTDRSAMVRFVVAYQTISDYLDNLCDRVGLDDESAFRLLHQSMADSLQLQSAPADYYRLYPFKADGDYLANLVRQCQYYLSGLPSLEPVAPVIQRYEQWYASLQSLKHLSLQTREQRLLDWAAQYRQNYPQITPWEFGASSGSTLGIFLLLAAAKTPQLDPEEVERIDAAYFPWVNGLHILLDYYIDAAEDREHQDLNFTFYYRDSIECYQRLSFFLEQALAKTAELRYSFFHHTVIRGLLALYLSDPKALSTELQTTTQRLLQKAGSQAIAYHRCCLGLRKLGII